MPTLNNRGESVGGQGDGIVSVKRTPSSSPQVIAGQTGPRAGGRNWVDDDTILYQTYAADGHAILETCYLPTLKRTRVSDLGANFFVSGGGRWCALLMNLPGGYGTRYDSHNMFLSSRGSVLAAGRDGTFALGNDVQQGTGGALYAPDGRVTDFPDEALYGINVVGPTSAIWTAAGGGDIRTLNVRAPKQVGRAQGPKVCRVGGEDWILYYTDSIGVICHPFDELKGYVLNATNSAFWYDAMGLNNTLRWTYALRAGEFPDDIVVVDVDLTAPRSDFSAFAAQSSTPAHLRTFTEGSHGGPALPSANSVVQAQLNLLEDDIVYRLSLLAVNVLQPLKNHYPNVVIKSGFRQVNTGISQHERGEAVDIQITNQTPELLYEVAHFIKNHLPFDQLVLNFTLAGDKQPWIHVSFSPTSLRNQVLTKDFADVFYEGLYLVEPLTGEGAASALRTQDARDALIVAEMTKLQNRENRLFPSTTVADSAPPAAPPTSSAPSTGGSGGGGGGTGGSTTGNAALVACVKKALGLPASSNQETNITNAFETTKRVAWLLRDSGCGLLIKNGGDNIVTWNGYSFAAGRVCFPDGQIFKVLSDVEGGTHVPIWDDNGTVDASLYVAPMDPGSDINLNWMQCSVPTT
jgi:hypothetical protein